MIVPWIAEIYKKFVERELRSSGTVMNATQWQEFMGSLLQTQDCVELAYNKYRCRMRLFSPFRRFLKIANTVQKTRNSKETLKCL